MGAEPSKAAGSGGSSSSSSSSAATASQRKQSSDAQPHNNNHSDHNNDHVHLDGHTPYEQVHTRNASTPPSTSAAGLDEDSGNYSALDTGPITLNRRTSSSATAPSSSSSSSSAPVVGDVITLRRHSATVESEPDDTILHPEVEAILNLAQFYPSEIVPRGSIPSNAHDLTPSILKPKALMEFVSTLQHRWSGSGSSILRAQVMIAREMEKVEKVMENRGMKQDVLHFNSELRELTSQLKLMPDLHASLQRQHASLAKCIQTMEDLNNLLPASLRLEPLSAMIDWKETKEPSQEQG